MKKLSRGQYVKKLDTAFSQYIRLKESVDGYCSCVTCGETKPWKEMQNGHFFSRGRYNTRWDEDNCHPQNYRCNVALNGNYIVYTRYMIDRYGREFVDELETKSKSIVKITTGEIKDLVVKYENLVKTLMEENT